MIVTVYDKVSEWFGVLGFLGFGKRYLNFTNKFTQYMSVNSFVIYIFHFGWIIFLQYHLSEVITSTFLLYILTVLGTAVFTLITIVILSKIPGLRILFGMKKKESSKSTLVVSKN